MIQLQGIRAGRENEEFSFLDSEKPQISALTSLPYEPGTPYPSQ
jgi:hypothetical protein